jgi:hypothetical protein
MSRKNCRKSRRRAAAGACRKAHRKPRQKPPPSCVACLREFLTPALWKQAQQAAGAPHKNQRWTVHPLVFVLLLLTWCSGDSQSERFATARACYVALRPRRRRPGTTFAGFERALARLPFTPLRVLAAGLRRAFAVYFAPVWHYHGFVPLGCDGSRLECPRTAELERCLGAAGKKDSAPTVWLTALVHLRTGLLWAWRLGKGTASELRHLHQMIPLLPALALVVADAAFLDYKLYAALIKADRFFLVRMSSRAYLYTEGAVPLDKFKEGVVWYWPQHCREKEQPPLRLRLLRIRGKKADVWLLTNVLERRRLRRKAAGKLYRWRWQNEGLFRTYKRTLKKVKLQSRTVATVFREAHGSLLALALQLALGVKALLKEDNPEVLTSSAREVLRSLRAAIEEAIEDLGPRQRRTYRERLRQARAQERQRRSKKTRRVWPRRKPHKPPKPPRMRTLSAEEKALFLQAAQAAENPIR